MILDSVEIYNFKSIKHLSLSFNENIKILVGKNEAGKSSILQALALLDESVVINSRDIRQPLPDEDLVEKAYIRFHFKLEKMELDKIIKNIKNTKDKWCQALNFFNLLKVDPAKTALRK